MPFVPREDDDGFIRTVEELENPTLLDDESSELEFGSDPDANEEERSTPFFATEKPSGWNLKDARAEAPKMLPFQTSIDEKIRAAQSKLDTTPPEVDPTIGDEPRKAKRRIGDSEAATTHGVIEDDESSHLEHHRKKKARKIKEASESVPEGVSSDAVKKGKKRLRKEKQSASKTFSDLHLSRPLLKAVEQLEWEHPTPVQARAIPYILSGRDVCGSAVTGSGKTGSFVLPVLERLLKAGVDNATRVVILLPTRELAAQCYSVITTLARYTGIRAALAVGGLSNKAQEVALRTRPHILVATPGRLIDHMRNAQSFSLEDVEILIMDEADRLLEMGFQAEVEEIIRNTRSVGRQTLLFSATISPCLKGLIKISLQNPINFAVDPMFDVATTLTQEFVKLKPAFEASKDAVLFSLVTRTFKTRTIIFFRQKVTAHRFKIMFGLTKLRAAELHGNLTQAQRLEALDLFRNGEVDFLLCTDLAARGLDIAGVETVINYDFPSEVKEYVHRVGRTARAGNQGRACSIICSGNNDERKLLKAVAKRAQGKLSARIVPPTVIGKWRAWVDSLGSAVNTVLKEEKQEKEMRMAEMELGKAGNMLKHADDIYARPARTWFQNESEKLEEKVKARQQRGLAPTSGVVARAERRRRQAAAKEDRRRKEEESEREKGYTMQRVEGRKIKRKPGKR
eukprot:GFKZ01002087.1.p1 GENE.GFKZ01002087.1~~GFKZ01002087.1.p1  ORF type:complete len:712 (+),score=115.76 GFKZ01002087.1:90-2138(+)